MTDIYIQMSRTYIDNRPELQPIIETHNGYEIIIYREYSSANVCDRKTRSILFVCALCRQQFQTKKGCILHCEKYHSQNDNANELSEDSNSEQEHNAADEEHQEQLADEVEAEHLRQVEAEAEEERQRILAAELEAEYQRKLADAAKHRQIAEQKRLAEEAERQRIAEEEAEQQRQLAEIDAEYQQKMSIRQHIITVETERKRAEELAIQTRNAAIEQEIEQKKITLRNRLMEVEAEHEKVRKEYTLFVITENHNYPVKRNALMRRYNELEKEVKRLRQELTGERMAAQQQSVNPSGQLLV